MRRGLALAEDLCGVHMRAQHGQHGQHGPGGSGSAGYHPSACVAEVLQLLGAVPRMDCHVASPVWDAPQGHLGYSERYQPREPDPPDLPHLPDRPRQGHLEACQEGYERSLSLSLSLSLTL